VIVYLGVLRTHKQLSKAGQTCLGFAKGEGSRVTLFPAISGVIPQDTACLPATYCPWAPVPCAMPRHTPDVSVDTLDCDDACRRVERLEELEKLVDVVFRRASVALRSAMKLVLISAASVIGNRHWVALETSRDAVRRTVLLSIEPLSGR
jgi:hypothetical protein